MTVKPLGHMPAGRLPMGLHWTENNSSSNRVVKLKHRDLKYIWQRHGPPIKMLADNAILRLTKYLNIPGN
jgi:hypothetical protein